MPSWDGSWKSFPDYRFAAQLELDGCKEDEKKLLAPRLVRNLTGRAWEACLEINREKLRDPSGVSYLLDFLKEKRGKQEVDLLGDALQQYFQTNEVIRREGENLNDYEQRHSSYVRDITKAMTEIGCKESVPTEIYGWFMINKLLRLDASDVAVVKAQTESYRLEDVMKAMRKMWGGESLVLRDQDRKKQHSSRNYMSAPENNGFEEENEEEQAWIASSNNHEPNDEEDAELEESESWLDQAATALAEDPKSETAYANFQDAKATLYREARKALDKHRTARGFFPTSGKGKGGPGKGFTGRCMRCGKLGHKAMHCRQNVQGDRAQSSKGNDGGRVGFVFTASTQTVNDEIKEKKERHVTWADQQEPVEIPSFAVLTDEVRTKAILDCGASESIVGAHTLQMLYEAYHDSGLDPEASVQVDRQKRRSFIFGNNETSLALGLAHVRAKIGGETMSVPMHVVEGQTPILLSSRWLEEQGAVINFQSGKARFRFLGDRQVQLEKSSTNHLLLPLTGFSNHGDHLQFVPDTERCPVVDQMSHSEVFHSRPNTVI